MPYFSIVIPVYNKAAFLKATLDSVLAQSFTDFELILVNDGSTDDSAKVIAGFKDDRIKYFEKENGGASTARNFGIAQATSRYITFLDADDYWYPDFLQEMFRLTNRFAYEKIFAAAIEIEMPEKVFLHNIRLLLATMRKSWIILTQVPELQSFVPLARCLRKACSKKSATSTPISKVARH
jgi:glycosyltransferase involved in cell wall biosynthesis